MSVSAGVRAVILVPTRELCEQVSEVITKLAAYCHHLVRHVFLSTDVPMDTQKHRLAELPDIVVATPGRLVQHLEKGVRLSLLAVHCGEFLLNDVLTRWV